MALDRRGGEAKASTRDQEWRWAAGRMGEVDDVNRRRYGRHKAGRTETPHTSLRSAYGATNNRRRKDACRAVWWGKCEEGDEWRTVFCKYG